MQGYILNTTKVKEEDLIVTLITQKRLKTLYRFYGARHSHINLGYKIDFVPVYTPKSRLGLLREVLHLGFSWQFDREKFYYWQQFCRLLYFHLKDVEEVDEFYFKMLDEASFKMQKQNPKRVLIEAYLKLLEFEGRIYDEFICFLCEEEIKNRCVLKRGYLLAHKRCAGGDELEIKKVKELFKLKSTLFLSDSEVDMLWNVLQEGL